MTPYNDVCNIKQCSNFKFDFAVVFAGEGGWLLEADIAFKSFKFWLVEVCVSNTPVERVSFFRRLVPFLGDSKRLVLEGDWNAILDPKIDKVGRGASSLGRRKSSLVDLMARHDLVDRFRLDHPGREMWTFHLIALTDHKLVWVSLRLANRPSLASYSLLEIRDFRDRLESLI